jgi:diguanylate cyclase (GGDEF)-like protein
MHSLIIGLAAALGVCVVAALELLRRLRRRPTGNVQEQVTATVQTLELRLDELAQELSSALRKAEQETERSRFLAQIGATIDLDEAIRSALEAATELPRVDAALIELEATEDEERVVESIGIDGDDGAAGRAFVGPPDQRDTRAVELGYVYTAEQAAGAMYWALGVPLVGRDGRIGWLGVFSRDPGAHFSDDDLQRLEVLGECVAPAIENARRFRKARQLADLDALTGLHNHRFFHETLARELDRANRYQRQLSLVLVDVDGFKEINDRMGHLAGDAALAEIADRVRKVVRSADIPCRVGGDELAVIVPEAEMGQARQLVGRIQRAVSSEPIAKAGRVRVSAGVADVQANDTPTSLFERADESLYAAKHAGKGGLAAAD